MKTKTIHASDLHFDHKVWRNELTFYKEELQILQARLDEIASKNTKEEVVVQIGTQQSRITRQDEVMDELLHDVNANASALEFYIKQNLTAIDKVHFNDHSTLRDKMDTFKKLYAEFKQELLELCAEWM